MLPFRQRRLEIKSCTIVLHTVLYSKVYKCTQTCLGFIHDNVCQICELTDVMVHANAFYIFKSFQLERLYITNLLHRFSVNVSSEGTREESKVLPVLSLFACIMATLNRNFTGCI